MVTPTTKPPKPDSQPISLRFALYTSSLGNYFFHEIRDLIAAGLKDLGITVDIRNERNGFAPRADWHLVIAPHEFFELGAGKDLAAGHWPANLILFNTEQPSSYWLALSVKHFERAAAIWDIDFDSTLRICKHGYACDYLPLGHVTDSALFQEAAQLPLIEETRHLPANVRDQSGFQQPLASRPIDLLFLGHGSPRRERYFGRHAGRLKKFNHFFHKPAIVRPMIPGQTTNMNTVVSVGLAQRSKILLNLHHGVDRYFEWHRIVLLGIAQRTLVVTEPCSVAPPFQANIDYVEAPLDELPDRIEYYLGSAAGHAEAQRIIEHGFETLTVHCHLSDRLRPLVEQLNRPAQQRVTSAERYFPVSISGAKPATPMSLCVITPAVAGEGVHADAGSAQVALAETLAQAGHRVTLLQTEGAYGEGLSASHWRQFFAARGIDYILLPASINIPIEATEACCRAYEAYLWLKEKNFAVIHFPETHGIGFYSLLAKRQGLAFFQTRFCLHAHGPRVWRRGASQQFLNQPGELELDFLERECFRHADALATSTRSMNEWLAQQKWPLPVERQWCPTPVIRESSVPATGTTRIRELAYLGPLAECPGLTLFCETLERLGSSALRDITVLFIDDSTTVHSPRTLAQLYDRARQWAFPWQITTLLPATRPACLRHEGRLIVLPSPQENSPANLRRCLAQSAPFLAAHCAGVAELIHPDDQALTLYACTATALAAALQKALREGVRPARPAGQPEIIQQWLQWHEGWASQNTLPVSGENQSQPLGPQPLVSVCLIHFNRPELLAQALASLRAQDYPHFEVVLVDDGSTRPEAIAFLAALETEFKQRNWQIVRQENRYLGAARNNGARHARGEYLVFMDDDNFAKPHQLSTFVRIARATGAEIVTSAMDLFTGTAAPQADHKPKKRWIFLGGATTTGVFRNCFGDANACIHRETFLRLGGFTEDYGITHEDWEFYARAVLQGCRLETTPEALFHYRVADQSMIRSTPRHANHLRSLRPYVAAVPEPLRDLVHLLQGSVLFPPEKNVPNPGLENLLRSNRRMVAIAKELIPVGQIAAAEAMFLEILHSASTTQQPAIMLQTMLEIGSALVEKNCGLMAENVMTRAVSLAKARNDSVALKEAEELFAIARNLVANDKKSPAKNPALANPPACNATSPSASLEKVKAADSSPASPSSAPLVSVIIPVFNNLALTQRCLESIARTTSANPSEIIIVDNASTDGTAEFLGVEQAAGRIRCVTNRLNHGFAHACNQGAQIARSPLLLFLNNDTQVTAGWLDAMAQAAQQPGTGIVGARLLYADGHIQHAGIEFINGVPDHPHRHAAANTPEVNQFRELDMVTGACFMIHRELFVQLAGFDETYQNGVEDIDLCLRVRSAGRKVVYEPKAVVYHLEGQSVGRFNHVNENLKTFFNRWGKTFNAQKHFVVPQPVKIVLASRSLLLKTAPSDTAKPVKEPVKIDWIGSFLDHGSLSHVNRELVDALNVLSDFQVNRISNGAFPSPAFEVQARNLRATASPDAAVTVRHAWPPDWKRPLNGKLAVIQPWEFGMLPEAWVRQACDVDEFWVPSNFVRDCYLASGIPAQKVFVVPNGVDAEKFHPQAAPVKLSTQKKFKFLFVGGTIGRKGPDLLLKAYLQNFTSADDVCLVIKDFGGKSFYAGQTFESQIRVAQLSPDAPEILYLNEELPPESLPGLYTACDCFVLPYRGEGFGLPVLEAMACGLPVIVTAGGAADDFVRDEFAWRIPATRKPIGNEVSGMKLAGNGWLLEPDPFVLGKDMRYAFANPGEARERGILASHHAHQFFSWKNSAAIAARRICELAASPNEPVDSTPVKATSAKLPPVALVGQLHEARRLLGHKKLPVAWEATVAAIHRRPFHPEAFLLLAEIALAAGDAASARECARLAHDFAPGWNRARQFLKKSLKGNVKPAWLKLPGKNQNHLSVCLIVKNEEKFLDQCLKSIHGLAQQIVVVDTGSTDRTVEIARAHGAEIHSFTWDDDFAAARNAALEQVTGDWVLILDADEELPVEQHPHLLADMAKAGMMAYRLPLVNLEHEAEGQNFVPRLFRNAPGVFYSGRIHEQVFPSLVPLGKSWGLALHFGTAQLLHHGYTKQMVQDRDKIRRNLGLLTRAVGEQPANANLMMNLGLELVRMNDLAGGVEKYRTAFKLMSAQKEDETAPELREVLLTQFTCQLYKIRAHGEVVQVLNSPLAKIGGLTASLHFALGLALFELKQFAAAAEQMRQCISLRRRPVFSPINTDILTSAPEHCLALSLAKTGDVAGAEKAFLAALAGSGRVADVKLDYAKFLATQNRSVEAFHKLHELVAANSRNLAAWRTGGEIALGRPEFLEFAGNWTAEAMQYVAEDFIISRQRAETLLLGGDMKMAAELWERLWNSERQPVILAALILCETLAGQARHAPDRIVDEPATSRAFIKWYQRLIAMRAHKIVMQINDRLDEFSPTVPTAVGMLEKALAEPQRG
jgi:GT2 family glycosyltransferase